MALIKWFTFLMKNEPPKKRKQNWNIDESKCLTENEVKKLQHFCDQLKIAGLNSRKFPPIRNWFMIELGLNAGLRVSEMASLKHGNLLIDGERSSLSFRGKGNKERSPWIGSDLKEKCQAYIKYKKDFGYSTDADSYLLNNLSGNKISKRALQKFFKQILKKSDLPDHYHIHCLRHTYATFFLKASNHDYRFLQRQLGHASIKTTQIYAGILELEGRAAIEKMYK